MSRGPGRWQAAILDELGRAPSLFLNGYFASLLGRPLDAAEVSAVHRAARTLARKGRYRTVLVHTTDCGCLTMVSRPDNDRLDRLSVERVPDPGTGSTLIKGSIRQLAREQGVSPTQVVRDLDRGRRTGLL
jgi:hypothetical protein